MAASASPSDAAVMVMDRFVSASSSQDAVESLEQMVEGFKSTTDRGDDWHPLWILDHDELPRYLVWLLQHGTLKNNEAPCEEGIGLVCQLYPYLVVNKKALQVPSPGLLLESLLDVLDHQPSGQQQPHPVYVRVLSLKVLEELSKRHKSTAMQQWLQAPNGLHRLADLLSIDVDAQPLEEAVRDQALQVAKLLAKEAALAKVFLFAEVECKLLDICWRNGGMTNGKPIVVDALQLVVELLKHADASLQDLVWQRPTVPPRLMQLIDLRGGQEFRHPEQTKGRTDAVAKSQSSSPTGDDDDDDLDSLLASGTSKTTKDSKKDETKAGIDKVPKLTPSEEEVVTLALQIFGQLLDAESLRPAIWKQHYPLFELLWDMGRLHPTIPAVCAFPSSSLQQETLSLVAEKINDPHLMDAANRLDSLLAMVCTGGGVAKTFDEKLATSQAALAVLRHTLSGDAIHDILMRTLAPPPMEDDDAPPPGPTVVQKLWRTVQSQLKGEHSETRAILLSGAFGGLGLMLCDEQSREIMSRLAPVSMDELLECVFSEMEEIVQTSMLRFFCEWTFQCPLVAHNLLKSPSSTHLAGMASTPSSYRPLVHLLLGLTMESLTKEEDCGGWTRAGILQIITKVGISKFTSSLEGLKTNNPDSKMPWMVSEMEYKSWKKFCNEGVLIVRKRVVEELAGGAGEEDSDNEDGDAAQSGDGTPIKQSTRPLRKLISQQAKEMEDLRQQLEDTQAKVASQEGQIETWRRRMESTPTDLDNMLNEFQGKALGLEETVRILESRVASATAEKDVTVKDLESKLSEAKKETERIRVQEQETRDDLERTEQEMQALSQAYSNLEIEYQRTHSGGAPTGETSQQHILNAQDHSGPGSLEVVTLRSENDRLRTGAKAADDWMKLAAEKMNELGASNANLQKQVENLQGELEHSRDSFQQTRVQQEALKMHRNEIAAENERLRISLDAANNEVQTHLTSIGELERRLLSSESEMADLRGLRKLLDSEKQQTGELEARVAAADAEMADLRGLRKVLESEKQRSAQLEAMLSDASHGEEQVKVLNDALISERQKLAGLQQQLSEIKQSDGRDDKEQVAMLREEYESLLSSKESEISTLRESLSKVGGDTLQAGNQILIEKIETANNEVREIKEKSQQEIYELESIVRELKDRLGSGLGAYTYEDIKSRDEQIEALNEANAQAQEWMAKAVELNSKNGSQLAKLMEEKAALADQLSSMEQRPSTDLSANLEIVERQLAERDEELRRLKEKYEASNAEFELLKKDMQANQGLLDDLGIAMEDVAVMQHKLMKLESEKKALEDTASGDIAVNEIARLETVNADLESRANELQEWSQMAQETISEITAAKDALQNELDEAILEKENLSALLDDTTRDNENELETLNETIKELENYKEVADAAAIERKLEIERLSEDVKALRHASEDAVATTSPGAALKELMPAEEATQGTLRAEIRSTEMTLEIANDKLSEAEAHIQKWKGRVVELENDVSELQQQLDHEKAQTIKLQELCEEAEQQRMEMEANHKDSHTENVLIEEQLKSPEEQTTGRVLDHMANVGDGRDDPETTTTAPSFRVTQTIDYEDVRLQWEVTKSGLEATVQSLQTQLQEQEEAANDAIDQWQDACVSAEERCTALEEELVSLRESTVSSSPNEVSGAGDSQKDLRESLSAKQRELEEAQETIENKQSEIDRLEDQIANLHTSLKEKEIEWTEEVAKLSGNLRMAKEKNASIQKSLDDAIAEKDEKVDNGEARASELQNQVEALQEQVDKQELESLDVIKNMQGRIDSYEAEKNSMSIEIESLKEQLANNQTEWEEKLDLLESERDNLRERIEQISMQHDELIELREAVSQDEEIVRQWENRASELSETVTELDQKVEALQLELAQQENDAVNAIAQWETNFSNLESRYANAEVELLHCNETISSRDWTIEQLKARNESIALQIAGVKLDAQINPALENDLVEAKTEISRLVQELESERQCRVDERERFEAEKAGEKGRNAEARDEIKTLNSLLEENKAESEDIVNEWSARFDEVKASLEDAKNLLREQEAEANEAITSWEIKAEELERDLDAAEQLLTKVKEILNADADGADLCEIVQTRLGLESASNQILAELEISLSLAEQKESELSVECESLKEEREELKEKLKKIESISEAKSNELSHLSASKSRGKLEEERDKLTIVIAQLEEELREANEMVQACITDESGDKATEAAAHALREELQDLNTRICELQRKYEVEKSEKEVATLEVERLREDLAAVVSLVEGDLSTTNLERHTTQAIEKVQKKERAEINEMKRALIRAMEDLDASRSQERCSVEKLSKIRLQLTMYEQEIIAAKSEISFLTQAMEELRETEESKRASLEYRVGSLEHENDVVRKYHSSELEGVRNDLSQITMDRDRILQQLKETEKTNASLVYAGLKEDIAVVDPSDLEGECVKLRVENAHLLTMAADDKARSERRLREMLAAQAASNEADVILQSELRVSAEAAVETLKVELAALRKESNLLKERSNDARREATASQIEELQSARVSLESLQKQNQELRDSLKVASREAQLKIESLTDECRTAQAKFHKMNQDGRFEALVKAERFKMSRHSKSPERLNLSESNNNGWIIPSNHQAADGEAGGPSCSSGEAFDLIQKQKEEILEERKMFRDMMQEYEVALALLAQLDAEKTALSEALGAAAAEEAIQKAHRETSFEIINSY